MTDRVSAELDLLQLDYARQLSLPTQEQPFTGYASFSPGLVEQLRDLNQLLYLHPQCRLVTNGGWGDPYRCAETVGQHFASAGNRDVVISAVRGCNLLPIVEELQAGGLALAHLETGAPLAELEEPIFAADLQIGFGPLMTAMAEDARVVIAGAYDRVAPLTATAAKLFDWTTSDADRLASAALAIRATEAPPRLSEPSDVSASAGPRRRRPDNWQLDRDGKVLIGAPAPGSLSKLKWQEWLTNRENGRLITSDLLCDWSALACQQVTPHDLELSGATGIAGDGSWQVNVIYLSHYALDLWIEDRGDSRRIEDDREDLSQLLQDLTNFNANHADAIGEVVADGNAVLHVRYTSKRWQSCREAADLATAEVHDWIGASGNLSGGIRAVCAVWPTSIPRDAVDIAVDTRTAQEWV